MRTFLAVAVVVALAGVARADYAAALRDADRLLADGASADAEQAAARLLALPSLSPPEQAQAHRIRGLAFLYLERRPEAESELRAYLLLEPDAHLDPALVPPDAVVFFESVRTRHAGELRIVKPRPKRKRYPFLALLPPLAQFQNGDSLKGWIITGAGAALLAANITTFVMLKNSCRADLTCDRDPSTSRLLRVVNLGAGALLVGLWAYGAVDGLIGYHRSESVPRIGLAPIPGGAMAMARGQF